MHLTRVHSSLDGMPKDALFTQIWSARALVDPSLHNLVVSAHKQYIEAGAITLCTSSYGVQPTYYRRCFGGSGDKNAADILVNIRMAADAETAVSRGSALSVWVE